MAIAFIDSKETGFQKIDLHHLHLDEAEELLFVLFNFVRSSLINVNKQTFEMEIVTGKGLHSQNGAVLMPYLVQTLKEQGHKVVSAKEGRIFCNIKQ